MLEKGILFRDQQKPGETGTAEIKDTKEYAYNLSKRIDNIKKAIDHITKNVDPEGYVRAATDYTWYKLMWFRDSSMISSSLSQASKKLHDLGIENTEIHQERAKLAAMKIISKEWEVISSNHDRIAASSTMSLENPEYKKLKFHIPARIAENGELADKFIDGRHINDTAESENPNSWLKQFDTVPLILYATSEFINSFGAEVLPDAAKRAIRENLGILSRYIINVYKCPCADAWEQSPDMLHSYSVAAAYAGLNSAMAIADSLGLELDTKSVEKEVYGKGGIKEFINSMFVKDGIMKKFRPEFGADTIEYPSIDASAYIVFALFDPSHYLIEREVYSKTMDALKSNHIFKSYKDGKTYYSAMPKRYEGDRYFGGSGWILLSALEAYNLILDKNAEGASKILDRIEELAEGPEFKLPEQEPIVEEFLNPFRESENDAIGKRPAMDLIWSAAEYLRASAAELELLKEGNYVASFLRKKE